MSKTKGQLRDAHNDLVLDNSRLRAVNGQLLLALKAIEWIANEYGPECLMCGNFEKHGHKPDCIVYAAIAEAQKATGTQP